MQAGYFKAKCYNTGLIQDITGVHIEVVNEGDTPASGETKNLYLTTDGTTVDTAIRFNATGGAFTNAFVFDGVISGAKEAWEGAASPTGEVLATINGTQYYIPAHVVLAA